MSIGVSLSQLISDDPHPLPTGLPALDHALASGLHSRSIYEIYGPPGIGKTRFGLQLVANTDPQDGVLWIETFKPLPSTPQTLASTRLYTAKVTTFAQLLLLFTTLRDRYRLVLVDGMSQLVCDHLYTLQKRSLPNTPNLHDLKCKHLVQLFSAITRYAHTHGSTVLLLNDCMNTAFTTHLDDDAFDIVDDNTNFYVTAVARRRNIQILKSSLSASSVGMGKRDAKWEIFLKNRIGLFWDWRAPVTASVATSVAKTGTCRVVIIDDRKRPRGDSPHRICATFDERARLLPLEESSSALGTGDNQCVYDSQDSAA